MQAAPLPPDETARMSALCGYEVLDTARDPRTDVFARLAADIFEIPIALVSLIDSNRQWFKAAVGLDAPETPRDLAFCAHAILAPSTVMVIEDAALDPRFSDNALVTGAPYIRFYAGAPIPSSDGHAIGTLCIIDHRPRTLDASGQRRLADLALGVASVLDLMRQTKGRQVAEQGLETAYVRLEKLTHHLIRARDLADQANRAKSRFLAEMSHELRTPLNGIIGYAQLLRVDGGLTASQAERVGSMLGAGKHLLQLIEGVLAVSEIEAETVALHLEHVDLRLLVEACIDCVGPVAQVKHLTLTLAIAEGVPAVIWADAKRLRQVLLNLLGNALKFTDQGGVELRVRMGADGIGLRLEVADTGPGILAAKRDLLFNRFERMDTDDTRTAEGAGLGLYLAQQLAARIGGQLGYEDNPGGGSVFWLAVRLEAGPSPLSAVAPDFEMPAMAPASNVPAARPVRALRVLVVDDIAMNRDIAGSFLRAAGHEVTCAADGLAAIAAVASTQFDVVLMDVRMPEMDGLEATRRIRALKGPCASVPIVALTAQAFAEQVAECGRAGMDSHLSKPFDQESLLQAVAHAAGARLARRDARDVAPAAGCSAAIACEALPVSNAMPFERMAPCLENATVASYLRKIAAHSAALLQEVAEAEALPSDEAQLATGLSDALDATLQAIKGIKV